jgi:hypothetical protein
MNDPSRDRKPGAPRTHAPPQKTCSSSCSSWLHLLKVRSFRQTGGGSNISFRLELRSLALDPRDLKLLRLHLTLARKACCGSFTNCFTQLRSCDKSHPQVLRGLHIRNPAIPNQPHSLKLELPFKLPSFPDPPPVPSSKHLNSVSSESGSGHLGMNDHFDNHDVIASKVRHYWGGGAICQYSRAI